MARLAAIGAVAAALLVAACTAPGQYFEPTPTPTPTPTPPPVYQAELRLPDEAATVVEGVDDVALAAGTSAALYRSAPLAVVAPTMNAEAQLFAASIAVALGAPLLLDPGPTAPGTEGPATEAPATVTAPTEVAAPEPSPTADPSDARTPPDVTTAELSRLGVLAVLTVGQVEVEVRPSVTVHAVPQDGSALAELLGITLQPRPVEVTGHPSADVAAVIALDRRSPTLLTTLLTTGPDDTGTAGAGTEGTDETDPSGEAGDTAAPTPTISTPPASTPTTTPTAAAPAPTPDVPVLPLTELAEAPDNALVLTSGDISELASVATARAAGIEVVMVDSGDPRIDPEDIRAIADAQPTTTIAIGEAFGASETLEWKVATAATGVELPGGGQTLFPGRRMVAMYGSPAFPALGILGEQDAAASIARVEGLVAEYQPLTADLVVPAFEIIVTIASAGPGEDGNYSNELAVDSFVPWIEAARDAGVYVVLDLQPGRTDFVTQARLYEPLLLYPNVGLALDPEWRLAPDQVHLEQIGSVGVAEVNAVADYLAELTRTNHLPQKLLMLHQFMLRMIQGRESVDTSHDELAVLLHADGQGSQPAKTGTWLALHQGAPAGVVWGWKNFIDEDVPMLTPAQTYQVQPVPHLVSYQ